MPLTAADALAGSPNLQPVPCTMLPTSGRKTRARVAPSAACAASCASCTASSASPRFQAPERCFRRVLTCQSRSSTNHTSISLTPFVPSSQALIPPRPHAPADHRMCDKDKTRGYGYACAPAHLVGLTDHVNALPLVTPFQNVLVLEHIGQLLCGSFKLRLIDAEGIGL